VAAVRLVECSCGGPLLIWPVAELVPS